MWLIAGLPALVLIFGLLRAGPAPSPGYVANMRFSVGLRPEPPTESAYTYDRYYTWLTAEYLADDLTEVVKSREIAEAVRAEAATRGLDVQVPPGIIQGATSGGKQHRILSVSLNWGRADELSVLAQSLATVLSEGQAAYFQQFKDAGTPIVLHPIDPPAITQAGPSTRSRLELPLRLSLALFAGVGVAFVLEYVDDTVRGAQDLRAQGIDVLGSIPRRSSLPWVDGQER
jgi:capsular polysaccharide biosynthesis protein